MPIIWKAYIYIYIYKVKPPKQWSPQPLHVTTQADNLLVGCGRGFATHGLQLPQYKIQELLQHRVTSSCGGCASKAK